MKRSQAIPRDPAARLAPEPDAPGSAVAPSNAMMMEQLAAGNGNRDLSLLETLMASDARTDEEIAFLASSWAPLEDFRFGNGGIFDASLSGTDLTITLKVAFDFVDGDPTNAPAGVPPEELAWTPDARQVFRDDYLASVRSAWSGKHPIRSTRPGWSVQLDTSIVVIESEDDPHFHVGVLKYPDDVFPHTGVTHAAGTHSVHRPGTSDRYDNLPNAPGDESGTAWMDSNATNANQPPATRDEGHARWQGARKPILFEVGRSDIDPVDEASITETAVTMRENPDWRAELTGRASADGDAAANFALSRDRSEAVRQTLSANGVEDGRIVVQNVGEESGYRGAAWKGGYDDPNARRVDIDLVAGVSPQTAAHETGHMFGLEDEYPRGAETAGTPMDPAYAALLAEHAELPAGGFPDKGQTPSIMSDGMDVMNWHYAPFVAAVKQITGSKDWTV